ncbi:MAG: SLC13 family permease, partial [Rhodospirillaceae bacterium]|nr:SLC13 family permease [Rhodospirillaceae bacterium]
MIIQPSKFIFLLSLLASVALYFWPTFNVTDQRIFEAAAVIMLAVGLWSTAIIPSFFGSLIFMFVAVVLSIAPPKVVFSGFHSGATWLVFGGLIFGLGVRKTGLDTRLVKSFLLYFPRFYTAIIYGVFW